MEKMCPVPDAFTSFKYNIHNSVAFWSFSIKYVHVWEQDTSFCKSLPTLVTGIEVLLCCGLFGGGVIFLSSGGGWKGEREMASSNYGSVSEKGTRRVS